MITLYHNITRSTAFYVIRFGCVITFILIIFRNYECDSPGNRITSFLSPYKLQRDKTKQRVSSEQYEDKAIPVQEMKEYRGQRGRWEWSSRPVRFTQRDNIGAHWTGGWVDPRGYLDVYKKRKSLVLSGFEPRTDHPTAY